MLYKKSTWAIVFGILIVVVGCSTPAVQSPGAPDQTRAISPAAASGYPSSELQAKLRNPSAPHRSSTSTIMPTPTLSARCTQNPDDLSCPSELRNQEACANSQIQGLGKWQTVSSDDLGLTLQIPATWSLSMYFRDSGSHFVHPECQTDTSPTLSWGRANRVPPITNLEAHDVTVGKHSYRGIYFYDEGIGGGGKIYGNLYYEAAGGLWHVLVSNPVLLSEGSDELKIITRIFESIDHGL